MPPLHPEKAHLTPLSPEEQALRDHARELTLQAYQRMNAVLPADKGLFNRFKKTGHPKNILRSTKALYDGSPVQKTETDAPIEDGEVSIDTLLAAGGEHTGVRAWLERDATQAEGPIFLVTDQVQITPTGAKPIPKSQFRHLGVLPEGIHDSDDYHDLTNAQRIELFEQFVLPTIAEIEVAHRKKQAQAAKSVVRALESYGTEGKPTP